MHRIRAGDTAALLALFDRLRSHQPTISGHPVPIACCFEAGRDGFWLHRLLTANGINKLAQRNPRPGKRDDPIKRLKSAENRDCSRWPLDHFSAPEQRRNEASVIRRAGFRSIAKTVNQHA